MSWNELWNVAASAESMPTEGPTISPCCRAGPSCTVTMPMVSSVITTGSNARRWASNACICLSSSALPKPAECILPSVMTQNSARLGA